MPLFLKQSIFRIIVATAIALTRKSIAFAPHVSKTSTPYLPSVQIHRQCSCSTRLQMSSALPEIDKMRISELKKELESYGISTRSFLEKRELISALEKARAEGKTPISSGTSSSSANASSTRPSPSPSPPSASRSEKLSEEMEKCKKMKASELKAELESYGISTKSFFEKSEFVSACAEARVDGVSKKDSANDSEGYAEYKNVEVLTSDDAGPRKKSDQQERGNAQGGNPFGGGAGGNPFGGGGGAGANPFGGSGAAGANPFGGSGGAGANPFGGGGGAGANPFGGGGGMPGGMGNIADMLKNMGMGGMGGGAQGGGAQGGNPFGGGANPFGGGMPGGPDAMKKAQELMQNPKVREIIMKAQSNPKVMAAVTECMSNPAAFAKYQNDPEVGDLIGELRKYM